MRAQPLRWFVVWTIVVLVRCAAVASTVTAEDTALRHVASAMAVFTLEHGRHPKTWDEFEKYVGLEGENRAMMRTYGFRLQDRYQFVSKPYPMFRNGGDYDIDEGSHVLLVRVIPFKDYRSDGRIFRTFVFQSSNGDIVSTSLHEERAQKLFKTYGVTIAVPAGLPEIETNATRAQPQAPGSLPDPSDAKRIGPSKFSQPMTGQSAETANSGNSSATVADAGNPTTLDSSFYVWCGIAVAILCSGVWLFRRLRRNRKID